MATVISLIRQWLDAAHAQTFLPPEPRGGVAFELGNADEHENETHPAATDDDELSSEATVGLSFLRSRAAHLARAREELVAAFPAHAPRWQYPRELWHPYAATVLHGKLARSISLAEIAITELYVHRAAAVASGSSITPSVIILLPDEGFESALHALTSQLRTEFRVDEETLGKSFLFFPWSQLSWVGAAPPNAAITVVAAPTIDPRARQWRHALLEKLATSDFFDPSASTPDPSSSAADAGGRGGLAPHRRSVFLLPSYAAPPEDLRALMSAFRVRGISERKLRLSARSTHEHLRMVLARHRISETFARTYFLRATRIQDPPTVLVALVGGVPPTTPGLETKSSYAAGAEGSEGPGLASGVGTSGASEASEAGAEGSWPAAGLQTRTPWSELDESQATPAHMHLAGADTLLDELGRAGRAGELGAESRCIVLCDTDAGRQTLLARMHHELPAELLHDGVFVRRLEEVDARFEREEDVRFLAVWCASPQEGLGGANLERAMGYLSMLETRSYAGVQLFSNSRAFCDAFSAERERLNAWLASDAWYGQRALANFADDRNGNGDNMERDLRVFLARSGGSPSTAQRK